jgi:hypothetical protein
MVVALRGWIRRPCAEGQPTEGEFRDSYLRATCELLRRHLSAEAESNRISMAPKQSAKATSVHACALETYRSSDNVL